VIIEAGIGANLLVGEAFKIIVARPTRQCRHELSFVRLNRRLRGLRVNGFGAVACLYV
jgi:hypothetical protein